jgi:hypothetical protein
MDKDDVWKANKNLLTPAELEAHMAREERFQAFWKYLPTSKLRNQSITVPLPIGDGEGVPIFCINCGRPHGAVTKEAAENGCVYICRPCAATHGGLPVPEVPEEMVRPRRE